jgi:hypothetical protein
MIDEFAQQIEQGITALLAEDEIEIADFDFYHLLPGNSVIAMVTAVDGAVFMVVDNLETGDGTYSEFPAEELQAIRDLIEAESPSATLAWVGSTVDGEFAFYKTAEGDLRSLKIEEAGDQDKRPEGGASEPNSNLDDSAPKPS